MPQSNISEEFLNILKSSQPGLLRTARRVLRDGMEAEDIVQEVAASVLSAPNLLEGIENIAAWLTTLVYRRSVDAVRRLSRLKFMDETEVDNLPSAIPSASEMQEEKEMLDAIAVAVEHLPEELWFAFAGNALDGKPFHQLSEESGIPMGTLMARKKRAVQLIKDELNRRGMLP